MSDAPQAGLREIAHKWWTPDPKIVAKLPRGGRDPSARCSVCGGWHKTGAVHLDFVGHADLTRALIEIDPEWQWEPVSFDDEGLPRVTQRGGMLVLWGRLTLLGKTMLAVGTCEVSKTDADKELVGDMLRNGGMRFGIFGSLWSKTDGWDDDATTSAPTNEGAAVARGPDPSLTAKVPFAEDAHMVTTGHNAPLPPVDIAQPDKPLAAMTMRELLDFAQANGITVSGTKGQIVMTLLPLVKAASGEEPWPVALGTPSFVSEGPAIPFNPVVADAADGSATARKQRDAINKTVRGE